MVSLFHKFRLSVLGLELGVLELERQIRYDALLRVNQDRIITEIGGISEAIMTYIQQSVVAQSQRKVVNLGTAPTSLESRVLRQCQTRAREGNVCYPYDHDDPFNQETINKIIYYLCYSGTDNQFGSLLANASQELWIAIKECKNEPLEWWQDIPRFIIPKLARLYQIVRDQGFSPDNPQDIAKVIKEFDPIKSPDTERRDQELANFCRANPYAKEGDVETWLSIFRHRTIAHVQYRIRYKTDDLDYLFKQMEGFRVPCRLGSEIRDGLGPNTLNYDGNQRPIPDTQTLIELYSAAKTNRKDIQFNAEFEGPLDPNKISSYDNKVILMIFHDGNEADVTVRGHLHYFDHYMPNKQLTYHKVRCLGRFLPQSPGAK